MKWYICTVIVHRKVVLSDILIKVFKPFKRLYHIKGYIHKQKVQQLKDLGLCRWQMWKVATNNWGDLTSLWKGSLIQLFILY